ncbi:LysM peptidoglycan-binding domain-containing protein [Bacillus sp. FJAT-29790]|uniref:LysM peptidoglycan-binding and 3D domain-containing protein n=1 Tax=Bacillus sp. FJAT-29790 TaxID=1895002 RepID=UPI001C24DF76|nr:3D domain-containing protein [Bacillus sp. FJAT-29790]MBU8879138.1 LysM peptidoglycan-binding domain-containing protein [Bacillus sp. FJAT-29790]
MKKSILAFVAATALTGTVGTSVKAEEVVVKKGDTLWGFSRQYHVSVDKIKEWNGLTSNLIHPNEKLEITPNKKYIVEKGDTLWNISRHHNVTVDEIKSWSNLNSDIIVPGQELSIILKTNNDDTLKQEEMKIAINNVTPVESVQATDGSNTTESRPTISKNPTKPIEIEGVRELSMEATAYTASCEGCSGITSTGLNLIANPDQKVISVDPSVIPLGSKVFVEGYGEAIAGDTGGAIKGNKIDIFIPSKEEALRWGRKTVKVRILSK